MIDNSACAPACPLIALNTCFIMFSLLVPMLERHTKPCSEDVWWLQSKIEANRDRRTSSHPSQSKLSIFLKHTLI